MCLHLRFLTALVLCCPGHFPAKDNHAATPEHMGRAPIQSPSDREIWREFTEWVEALPRLPCGRSAELRDRFVQHLVARGIPKPEAEEWLARIDELRSESVDRERVYWDGKFKLRGGPSKPLPLLEEAVSGLPPGKALDVAMGLGRNGLYLASLGWEVTGYDLSGEAVEAAAACAERAGLKIKAVQAAHGDFDFGNKRWDLIVVCYAYIDTMDPRWPPRLYHALKPGGLVVFQGNAPENTSLDAIGSLWRPFQLIRLEALNSGEDWLKGQKGETIKIVARRVIQR
jgi:SAM-dependent methyltransferase